MSLIDRDLAIRAIAEDMLEMAITENPDTGDTVGDWMLTAESILSGVPDVQTEIVYCKECSRYSNGYCHHPETYGMYVDANHFCGYAEVMANK